jgi:acetylornithine deacetylase
VSGTGAGASRDAAEVRNETMLLLGDLIGFPTVTDDSNLGLIAWVAERLDPLGAELTLTHDRERRKANLFATIGPPVDGGVVLSGHTDVVPAEEEGWTVAPFIATRRGQRIYGRGATDMKGFIACALAMAPAFAAAPLARPVHLALTFDEEVGCRGAPLLLAALAENGPRPSAAIVGEPTSMRVAHGHKGCHEFTTTITGLEGHGSAPRKGVNAVEYGARYVDGLLALRAELAARRPATSPYDPPETTLNVGVLSGGSARNVVAGACTIEWELRPVVDADGAFAMERVRALEADLTERLAAEHPDATLRTTVEGAVDGLEPDDGSAAVDLAHRLLGTDELDVVPYSTEAGLFQRAGIPAVVCGPGSIDVAHRPDEYVPIEQLEACLAMLGSLVDELTE